MEKQQPELVTNLFKPAWKVWLYGAVLFLIVFLMIKEASKPGEKPAAEETMSFDKVDALPSFPTGERAFGNYLQQNIHTDGTAKGRVIAAFVVDKTGALINVRILRGLTAEADQEVIRVLEKSPRWVPGRKDGKAVRVAYTIPVNFDK